LPRQRLFIESWFGNYIFLGWPSYLDPVPWQRSAAKRNSAWTAGVRLPPANGAFVFHGDFFFLCVLCVERPHNRVAQTTAVKKTSYSKEKVYLSQDAEGRPGGDAMQFFRRLEPAASAQRRRQPLRQVAKEFRRRGRIKIIRVRPGNFHARGIPGFRDFSAGNSTSVRYSFPSISGAIPSSRASQTRDCPSKGLQPAP